MLSGLFYSRSQERSIVLVAVVGLFLEQPTDLECCVSWFSPYELLKTPGNSGAVKAFPEPSTGEKVISP